MFVFAHVFYGALIGVGFWHQTHDRRALPLCILGAILPDLLDKSLAMVIPGVFGSGRTLGHSLFFCTVIMAAALLLWHYRHTLLGIAFACAVFSHQILDSMWLLPSTWFFPFRGPFQQFIIPDYVGHYFWLELFSLSEWVFALSSLIIIGMWYMNLPGCGIRIARVFAAIVLGAMGFYLLLCGLVSCTASFFAPTYSPVSDAMAGLIALGGAIILVKFLPMGGEIQ